MEGLLWPMLSTLWGWYDTQTQTFFQGLRELLLNVFYAIYDAFLSFFSSLVSAIPVPASWQGIENPLNALPDQSLYLINALGVPRAIAIIAAAWGVRFALNLIPAAFTRI